MASSKQDNKTCHLCVFVHGLWGNPSHLERVVTALKEAHPDEPLEFLVAEKNIGNSTYDGIEVGAERVTQEIEDYIKKLKEDGKNVTKLSITGYSLGGLVGRYVVGLLYSRGVFKEVKPYNFTTFATPHLGVRAPLAGWANDIWNNIGGKTLSTTGMQLFTVDKFRDTDRPLLAVMADPGSIFVRGLSEFKRRSLYANIVNDRAVPWYTAYITRTDPFVDLDAININYVDGYENVILDSNSLATKKTEELTYFQSVYNTSANLVTKAPLYLLFGAVIPIGGMAYLVNSGIQNFRSAARIKLHEEGKLFDSYRMPLMLEGASRSSDLAIESINGSEPEEYLSDGHGGVQTESIKKNDQGGTEKDTPEDSAKSEFPTLALTEDQFYMIDNLNKMGIDKYAVHIQKASHSHAAIVVRTARAAFTEGKIVFRHWTERFEL